VKFLITMNMPARSGVPIHQIICEHPATSVDDFADALGRTDFIVVEEFYRDANMPSGTDGHYSVGRIVINPFYIGKVKAVVAATHANRGYHEA
jgi:hypothetical protein